MNINPFFHIFLSMIVLSISFMYTSNNIISFIWTILFIIFGYVHYLLYNVNKSISVECILFELFVLFCAAHPLMKFKYINYLSLLFSFGIALMVMHVSLDIFWYLVPILLWMSYINIK